MFDIDVFALSCNNLAATESDTLRDGTLMCVTEGRVDEPSAVRRTVEDEAVEERVNRFQIGDGLLGMLHFFSEG